MKRSRSIYRYTLRVGKRVTYCGVTNDPQRRAREHHVAGRRGTMRIEGPPVTKASALAWERQCQTRLKRR